MDCLDAYKTLLDNGYNPLLLNMANPNTPGGGWKGGCGAQEENLFRRSNYQLSLINKNALWKYPMHEFGGIYSKNIIVFRGNEKLGYPLLDKPFNASMVACAMYKKFCLQFFYFIFICCKCYDICIVYFFYRLKFDSLTLMISDNQIIENIKRKMISLLRIGIINGHNSLVLGAWGCGAYKTPPKHMSLLFKQILNKNEFKNKFRFVIFAILDDHNTGKKHNPNGNFKPFVNVFGQRKKIFLI